MASGDLSTDLSLRILTPTPSVRPAEGHSPPQEAESKARRRPQPAPQNSDDDASSEIEDPVPHQLDRLA